ncbi:MAG: cyclic-di-AMP receptor [Eubacterium sp.]|nr:cyclic-di-AMP receptor [Eubacterium sp.]
MKLVIAIISNTDTEKVISAIALEGYSSTKISTRGQFLVDGHTTLLIGCDDEKVKPLLEIMKNNVTKRTVASTGVTSTITGSLLNQAVDVEKYGIVAFIVNVEEFIKL